MTLATTPAKLILCGEHAVVYSRPAIALPLSGIRARVEVADSRAGSGIAVHARDLGRHWRVADDPHGPISELIRSVLSYLTPSPPRPTCVSPSHPRSRSPAAWAAARPWPPPSCAPWRPT